MPNRPAWYRALVQESSRLKWLIIPLILLSIADILVTYLLLRSSPRFYEANRLAYWLFTRYNIAGMIALKFGGVSIAIIIAEIVERYRPHYGKFVLLVGIAATAWVVYVGYDLFFNQPLYLGDER